MSQASALEQYVLELVNRERKKAGVQPLAFDGDLNEAADAHGVWMIGADTFSHTGSGGSAPVDRMKAAGYAFTESWSAAENIAWASLRNPAGLRDEADLLHTNLMNSPGHRANILNGSLREIGIGFQTGEYKGWQSAFIAENFAKSGSALFITGVAFDDKDGDRFYDPGEGLGGLAVKAVKSTGETTTAKTGSAGGYGLALAPGTYMVTFSGGGYTPVAKQVTVGTKNVKLDWIDPAAGAVAGVSAITGTDGGDTLTGGAANDAIKGLGGNDRINGAGGADRIDGGIGRDMLAGGAGNDRLSGGADADTFRFRGDWGRDRITDFQNGTDHLDLRTTGLSFADLAIAARDLDRDGSADDALVTAQGHSIGLLNIKAAEIGASDFLF